MFKNYRIYLLLFIIFLFLINCSGSSMANFTNPDEDGSIRIINKTGEELVLYLDKQPIKKIHKSSYPFKVKLPSNIGNYRVLIWLFFYEDVKNHLDSPQNSGKEAFKTDSKTIDELQTNCEIEVKKEDRKTGVITFYYNIEDVKGYNENIQLDIYKYGDYDPKERPLLSISPGEKDDVEISYGTHRFTYRYVAPDGTDYIIHLPNQVALSNFNSRITLETILPTNKQATLKITNTLHETVTIFTEDFLQGEQLLEANIHLLNKEHGISWINPNQSIVYQLEENQYCFYAKNNKEEILSLMELNIKAEGKGDYTWAIKNIEEQKKPKVSIKEPENNSTDINTYTNIIFDFTETMSDKVTEENIHIKNTRTGKIVNGDFMWNTNFTQAVFTPFSNYITDTKYHITVNKSIMALSGKNSDQFVESVFTTSPIKSQPNFITNPLIDLGVLVKQNGERKYDKQLTLEYDADKGFFSTDYVFREGDKFKLSFIAQESYSLFFIGLNQKGQVGQLFPYEKDDEPRIEANTEYMFPTKHGYGIGEPFGKDLFILILSKNRNIKKEEIKKNLGISSQDIENIIDLGESLFKNTDDLFISNRGDVAIYGLEVNSAKD